MVPNIEKFAIQQTVLEQTAVIVKYKFIKCKQSVEGSIISQIFKEEGFTPYGQSRDFYLGRVIYSPFTWFGVRRWGMRTPLISDCGQRCEVTA